MRSKRILITITAILIMLITVPAALAYLLYNDGYRVVFPNEAYYPKDTFESGWTFGKGKNYDEIAAQWLKDHYVKFTDEEDTVIYPLNELDINYNVSGVEKDSFVIDERNCSIKYYISENIPEVLESLNEGRSIGSEGELSDVGTGIEIANKYDSDLIDLKCMYQDIEAKISEPDTYIDSNTLQIKLSDYYVYEDSSDKYSQMESQLEKMNNFSIEYTNGFVLNSEVLYNRGLLYVENDEIKVKISDEDTRSICARNLTSYNTVGTSYEFTTHDNKEITVDSITYGNYINYQSEAEYLVDAIINWKSEDNRIPIMKQSADIDISNTYLEVDENKQHAYYFENNELVWDSDVVTGKPTAERETHKGIYFIYNKAKDNVHLEKYDVTVQRWMSVTYDGQGFHDASWRSSFGGTIYKTNGSHGCINTPKDAMYKLYDLVKIGTPVIIY